MNRVTNAPVRKRYYKKVLKKTKGYIHSHRKISKAIIYERLTKQRQWVSRRLKKRDQRRFWNKIISIWARNNGTCYSRIIGKLLEKYHSRKEVYLALQRYSTPEREVDIQQMFAC